MTDHRRTFTNSRPARVPSWDAKWVHEIQCSCGHPILALGGTSRLARAEANKRFRDHIRAMNDQPCDRLGCQRPAEWLVRRPDLFDDRVSCAEHVHVFLSRAACNEIKAIKKVERRQR